MALSFHQSMWIAKYPVIVLLREYKKGINTESKLIKRLKKNRQKKEEEWIHPLFKSEKLKRYNGPTLLMTYQYGMTD